MGKAATIGAVTIGTITITTTTGAASAPREPGLGEPVMPPVHEEPLEACALLASPQPTRFLESRVSKGDRGVHGRAEASKRRAAFQAISAGTARRDAPPPLEGTRDKV